MRWCGLSDRLEKMCSDAQRFLSMIQNIKRKSDRNGVCLLEVLEIVLLPLCLYQRFKYDPFWTIHSSDSLDKNTNFGIGRFLPKRAAVTPGNRPGRHKTMGRVAPFSSMRMALAVWGTNRTSWWFGIKVLYVSWCKCLCIYRLIELKSAIHQFMSHANNGSLKWSNQRRWTGSAQAF